MLCERERCLLPERREGMVERRKDCEVDSMKHSAHSREVFTQFGTFEVDWVWA